MEHTHGRFRIVAYCFIFFRFHLILSSYGGECDTLLVAAPLPLHFIDTFNCSYSKERGLID